MIAFPQAFAASSLEETGNDGALADWQARNEQDIAERLEWLADRLQAGSEDSDLNRRRFRVWEDESESTAFCQLARRLGLSKFEQQVLLLCASVEWNPDLHRSIAQLPQSGGAAGPTFSLALSLLDEPRWDALSPHRPLRRLRVLEIHQPPDVPLVSAGLRSDERIVNYLRGLNELDDRLSSLFLSWNELETSLPELPASQSRLLDELAESLSHAQGPPPVLQLLGGRQTDKRLLARHFAERVGCHLMRIPWAAIPQEIGDQELFLRLWERECGLLPLGMYLEAGDVVRPSQLSHFLARIPGLVVVDVWDGVETGGRPTSTHDVSAPTVSEQRAGWLQYFQPDDRDLASQLAVQFHIDAVAMRQIARCPVRPQDQGRRGEVYWDRCRRQSRPQLEGLAQRIDAKATWEQLVLPERAEGLLREVAANIRHRGLVYDDWGFDRRQNRGLGVAVLFAGESGTGKTMAAEVLANDLRLDLYRIDLSAIVDKYIGETEKNLRKVFDAAEAGGAVLLFDEADALFGKRTEVKDSHDRYANIETNYLLQRIESFRGLAILSTNLKSNLDSAFLRRLRYSIDFPLPDRQQRLEIWQTVFPEEMPRAALDYEHLAELPLTGGNIQTIALNAAFSSAADGSPLDMPHLLHAARVECGKLKKSVSAGQFRWKGGLP